MARNNKSNNDTIQLTKRQASIINRGNRKISGNVNALMDEINNMTYGVQRTDKIDSLTNDFKSLLKSEISNISKSADGDTTSFITKLFSENNKRMTNAIKDIDDLFSTNEGQLEAFLTEQYRNRMIKQADLHEVASQLVELQEAITITRDAIISADIINGHMTRTITFGDDDIEDMREDYVPIIEKMEKKFKIQEKIKNFIIPKSLEYGEYYVYVIPYSKIFEDFSKEKNKYNRSGSVFSESYMEGCNLYDFANNDKRKKDELYSTITESVQGSRVYNEYKEDFKDPKKAINSEMDSYLKNITVNNNPVPLGMLEEGIDSYMEYYTEFVEKTITEEDKTISFENIMKGIDDGVHLTSSSKTKSKKEEKFTNIKDCYMKLIDPMHLLPIEIMNECIGYYYIQEEDITPLSGILTSTVYYDKFNNNRNENNILSNIADTIVSAFDKKFLEKNIKFKNLIVEALNYYKLNNRKIKFQFIPKEYIIPFTINEDENGHGVSIIEPSLFYAKLYLMLLLFKMMTIIMNSNDTKVNYIKQSGIEKNVMNKIQEIARKKQQRQITLTDMFSYTTLINKIGQGSEMYVPIGKSGDRGIETEILSGQEVQLNTDFMEMLKKAYISGTGVPDVLMNYINEADFAKTLELANNRFHARVVSFQLDYNEKITELYKAIAKYSTTIPEDVLDSLQFNFMQPKYQNTNITNELLNNHNSLMDFLVILYFGQQEADDPDNLPKVKRFKKKVSEEKLPMLNFDELDKLYREACIEGTEDILNPDRKTDEI